MKQLMQQKEINKSLKLFYFMKKILIIIPSILAVLILGCCIFYNINLKAVSNKSEEVKFIVENGSTYYDVISKLKKEGLIRSELCFKLYVKLNKVNDIEAGAYKINKNMSVKKIIKEFSNQKAQNPDAIIITFKEGLNIKDMASLITKYTNNKEEDIFNLLKDQNYLNDLINKYWFIDESILNSKIYYSLEGYLFPDTYEFKNKDVSIKDIFESMLDNMDKKISQYKTDIISSNYSIHQIFTLSSLVEKEGKTNDFNDIASTFVNRMNDGMTLSSCASAYYGARVDFNDVGIATSEMIQNNNPYNTYVITGLPIGPISSFSIEAFKSVLYLKDTKYLYFLSDNEGNTYFFENYIDHRNKKQELQKAGKWLR